MVDEQATVSIYRRQPYACDLESFQLGQRRADVCMVEHDPRLVRELQVPVSLHQHALPVADLCLDRDETLEWKGSDGGKVQRVAGLHCYTCPQ